MLVEGGLIGERVGNCVLNYENIARQVIVIVFTGIFKNI